MSLPLHIEKGKKVLMPYFNTFHFTTFALPCAFVKDETIEVNNYKETNLFLSEAGR
jgi:hypothetical protein